MLARAAAAAITGARRSRLGPFDPSQDADLQLWLRGDLGVTLVGSKVSVWADQSGNGRDVTQGTDANRPTTTASHANFNNQATITFSPTQWLRNASYAAIAQPYRCFLVARVTAGATNVVLDDGGGNVDSPAIFFSSSLWRAAAGTNLFSSDGTLTGTRAHLLHANGASSDYFIDDFTTPNVSGNAGANASNSLTVGANNSGAGAITGDVAEVVITTGGSELVSKYRDYLNARYGLSVT